MELDPKDLEDMGISSTDDVDSPAVRVWPWLALGLCAGCMVLFLVV